MSRPLKEERQLLVSHPAGDHDRLLLVLCVGALTWRSFISSTEYSLKSGKKSEILMKTS